MSEQFKSIETTELVKIANAIRTKTGSNEQITLKDMPDKIRSIEGGGIYLPELEFEGSSTDLLAGKQLIDSEGNIVTGTIPTKTNNNLTIEGANITVPKGYYESDVVAEMPTTTQATPTISVNSAGKITATVSQSAGYIEAGTKTTTHQLDVQAAQTITPSTSDKTIAAGKYLTGTQTIKGDANLKAESIAEGVSIFGVTGTYVGSGGSSGNTSVEDGLVTRYISGTYTNGRVTSIGSYAFQACTSLTTVNFPVATTIGVYTFNWCSSLTTVSFPAATYIGSYAFYNCRSLTTVSFPVATSIGNYAFYNCRSLTTVSFPVATSIGSYAFLGCFNLKSLYLTGSKICKLSHSNAFDSTPIGGYSASAGTYGSIYVPASMLAAYQTATNWTYFSSRFVGI